MAEVIKDNIIPRNIEEEMKGSYIDYAMSVIVGRALPDVRDGLKPVHRRILYAMKELGLVHNKAYRKSATVVGDVLGKYHPHGDASVYDSIVRMVQEFSLRHPLIDGQGNFGSIDGDPAAAYRYTEVRMEALAEELLKDIDRNTVDFIPTFDNYREEPTVLPAAFPNLLVNGSSGIAVGMATNIPPHNLGEVIDALVYLIDTPTAEIKDLMKFIKGPDFPTAATIRGKSGIRDAYLTGRGSIMLQSVVETEAIGSGKEAIIIKELPYQVNKASLLESIADLVKEKRIEGITDLRDESDREGIRVVIELKRDTNTELVINQLMKHTQMQTSFGIIMLALVNNRPRVLNLREMLSLYLKHRQEITIRRTKFDLAKAEARAHILEGLKIAVDNINKVVKTIKESKDVDAARLALMENFGLSKIQAQAILDMRLQQLTGLELEKLEREYLELLKTIERLKAILADPKKVLALIKEELLQIKEKYDDKRRTKIISQEAEDLSMEDLIEEESVVVTISNAGYVKRIPASTYHSQNRGGKGVTGVTTREDDFIEDVFVTSTHDYMLLFSNIGRVYWIKVYEIPEGGRVAKGKAIVNLVKLYKPDEMVTAAITIHDFNKENQHLIMITKRGVVKKTPLSEYSNPRAGGIIAINLDDNDELMGVKMTDGSQEIIIGTRNGLAIHFEEKGVRPIGRVGKGVRGIELRPEDQVVGMEVVKKEEIILVATENGYGKKTKVKEYRTQSRGGKGVINIKANQRNGQVIAIKRVTDNDDIMLITQKGVVNRQPVKSIGTMGRNTQGVRLIRLQEGDKLVSIARLIHEDETLKDEQDNQDDKKV